MQCCNLHKVVILPLPKIQYFVLCIVSFSHFEPLCKQKVAIKVANKLPEGCQKVVAQLHCVKMHQANNQNGSGGLVIQIF